MVQVFTKMQYRIKFLAIFDKIGFVNPEITRFRWKENRDMMLRVKAYKGK